jgi:hypothetical protein
MKEKKQVPELRMNSATFDKIMQGAFQVAPPAPKKGKTGRRKKAKRS